MTGQTNLRAMILIPPMTVIVDVSNAKKESFGKISDKNMSNINRKIADDSI